MARSMLKSHREQSPTRRLLTLLLIAASLALVAAAERDIQRRSDAEVCGSKLVWRLVCLNALGAAGYFRWGRRGTRCRRIKPRPWR
jgi:hypothetical protein